jgi:hypothetical protein
LNPSSDVVSHAQIYYAPNLRSRPLPKTTGTTTCVVWNDLLTNELCCGKCASLGGVGSGMVIHPSLHGARGAMVLCTNLGNHSIARVPQTTIGESGI